MISFNEESKIFHLSTKNTSYVFGALERGYLIHLYWGKHIDGVDSWAQYHSIQNKTLSTRSQGIGGSIDVMRMEYSTYGSTDLRTPAFACVFDDGSAIPKLFFKSYKIIDGKPGHNRV